MTDSKDSGLSVGAKRLTTFPSRLTRNFVKFATHQRKDVILEGKDGEMKLVLFPMPNRHSKRFCS